MMKNRVAVVILNYNGSGMLQRFLPTLIDCSSGADIVVADNGSSDDSMAIMERDFPNIRTVLLDRNYGFAEGYNQALAQIEAEYYILLNSDVEVTEGWIQPLLELMDADSSVAACQPKIKSYCDKGAFEYAGAAGGFIDYYGYPYCRGRIFDTVEQDNGRYDDVAEIFWATGAAFMIRSKLFFDVGGLDARFFAHMEEIDLCWRLKARGYSIKCIPQSVIYHVGGATLSRSNPHKTFLNFRNNLLMLYKNLPQEELNSVMRMRAILDAAAAVKFLLTGCPGDFKAVCNARREFRRMKSEYYDERSRNLSLANKKTIPQRTSFSILWQYYFRGRKIFDNLPETE